MHKEKLLNFFFFLNRIILYFATILMDAMEFQNYISNNWCLFIYLLICQCVLLHDCNKVDYLPIPHPAKVK